MSTDWQIAPGGPASEALAEALLVDHHVHGVVIENPSIADFANMITESDRSPASISAAFDTQVGFAVRRWCAPKLDLPSHAEPEAYFARRIELGAPEVNRRLLQGSGIGHFLIETGYRGDEIHGPKGMAELTGANVSRVIRLETIAEMLVRSGETSATTFVEDFRSTLAESLEGAVAIKSIAAYRIGLDFDSEKPSLEQVRQAAGQWLAEAELSGNVRVSDPILLRHLIWQGVEFKKPIQFHIGYGDPDLNLHKCDPLLMTELIRKLEVLQIPVMLLHTYPFQRNAGYLAQMFNNVYLDVGLAINYTGARSPAIIAESLELAPFSKLLFSSDAWGLSELTYLGALLFRRGLGEVLDSWVARGDWSAADAISVVKAISSENAARIYGLVN
ncbi:MAG TPA: amidohydrolase family protein [Candidatus Nanopelagicaceae bacterium]|nr:amidohydrolase family protein [Candidatus Nanopelagicaceae bacterium]